MKKHLIVGLFLMAGIAHADNEMAWTPNKAGGSMFFTYSPCVYIKTGVRIPESFYVYSTNTSGVKIADGCYRYKYPFYLIEWNEGGNTNINVNTVTSLIK
jgi:hypothetical protein